MQLRRMYSLAVLALLGAGVEGHKSPLAPDKPQKLDVKFLPNSYQVTANVISGGQPDGEKAFAELAALGVKTVVSVDGAKPDVAAARKYGLRYVHLPHGYDGVPESRIRELAKVVRDLPGPVYIHCHHGKHRSPAAATVACVAAGLLDPAKAEQVLKSAGTSANYRGLYASVRNARVLGPWLLDELRPEFPETAKLPPLAEAMVALERTHDHLRAIAAAGWKPLTSHPDLAPAHEALLLREHFTEMLRLKSVSEEPAAYRVLLKNSESAANDLEAALKSGTASSSSLVKAKKAFAEVNRNCAACHSQFRDVPLDEKKK